MFRSHTADQLIGVCGSGGGGSFWLKNGERGFCDVLCFSICDGPM